MTDHHLEQTATRPPTWTMTGVGSLVDHAGVSRERGEVSLDDGRSLVLDRRGFYRWRMQVRRPDGTVVGTYDQTGRLRAGGPLTYEGQRLELVSLQRNAVHLELRHGATALVECGADSKRVQLRVPESQRLDDGLLLFLAWICQQYGRVGNGVLRLIG